MNSQERTASGDAVVSAAFFDEVLKARDGYRAAHAGK